MKSTLALAFLVSICLSIAFVNADDASRKEPVSSTAKSQPPAAKGSKSQLKTEAAIEKEKESTAVKPSAPTQPTITTPAATPTTTPTSPPEKPRCPVDLGVISSKFESIVAVIESAVCGNPLVAAFKPHLRNLKVGALSVAYGPLTLFTEAARLPSDFWVRSQKKEASSPSSESTTPKKDCWCLFKIFAGSSLHSLARFEFSIGSFVSELIVFQFVAVVIRRWSVAKRLRSSTHLSWLTLVALAAIPTGIFDISALAAAAGGVPVSAFASSLLIGKILKPYVTVLALWTIRAVANIDCLSCVVAPMVALIQTGAGAAPSLVASASAQHVQCAAVTATVVVLALAWFLPRNDELDIIDDADE